MPLELIDDFVDVDFLDDKWREFYVFGDLGVPLFGDSGESYESRYGVLSDAEIDAAIEAMDESNAGPEWLVTRIYDQKQEGSCVANATCQAHEITQAKQYGKDRVIPLSAMSLYKRIGRSASSGAMVSDGWKELNRRGALPLDTPENRARFGDAVMPNTGFRTPFPANWEATGSQFAGLEATTIRSTAGLWTALANQDAVVVGRQGHSITYVRPTRSGGRRRVGYPNSWSLRWGQPLGDMTGGWGFDSESQIRQSASWAFAVRSVKSPLAA
jgi:hypothetical protein